MLWGSLTLTGGHRQRRPSSHEVGDAHVDALRTNAPIEVRRTRNFSHGGDDAFMSRQLICSPWQSINDGATAHKIFILQRGSPPKPFPLPHPPRLPSPLNISLPTFPLLASWIHFSRLVPATTRAE